MESLRLIVSGRVQKVGYRGLVDEIAFALNVRGQVKNLENKTVEIIAEHEDKEVLDNFVKKIKINEYPIRVSQVIIEEIDPKNFKQFEVIEGPLETENRESLEAGAIYMRKLASEQKMMREELGEKFDSGFSGNGERLDSLTKATTERFDAVDTKYGKISDRLEKINDSLERLIDVLEVFKPK